VISHFFIASSNTYKPVGPDAQHVVKVEPHKNGPLFVEINCYLRVAKSDMSKYYLCFWICFIFYSFAYKCTLFHKIIW